MSRVSAVTIAIVVAILFSVLATLSTGSAVSLSDVAASLGSRITGGRILPPAEAADNIVWLIRIPRALMALAVGGGLAVVGVAMQALVRNPLAEPYILGLSSGASAGASLFFLGLLPPLLSRTASLSGAAFLGGLASVSIVYLIARDGSRISVARLLLAGVAMSALMGSVTSLITFASPDPDKLRTVLFWLLGSLGGSRWEMLPLPLLASIGGGVALLGFARQMDALLVGEEPAQSLGVSVELLKVMLILIGAFVTGTLVAAAGVIGFVGLVIPHIVRLLVGVAHHRVLPLSFGLGAVFLMWSDLVARSVLPSQDIPVGIVTAVCGVPFFLALLRTSEYRFG
ncbi:MAG: iron ABC transporter permease [Rhodothermales bacterium]|nr:iron ABC transporter permease [Rhodothermales bacterium]